MRRSYHRGYTPSRPFYERNPLPDPPQRIVTEHVPLRDSQAVQERQDATVERLRAALKGTP